MKNDDTTARLDETLAHITDDHSASDFLRLHAAESYNQFYQYFNDFVAANNLDVSKVHTLSHISPNYVHQITNGKRPNPGRDKIIALCIACGMSFRETNRALKIAGVGVLYAKNERDVRIAICINNHVHDVLDVNLYLEEYGLPILDI